MVNSEVASFIEKAKEKKMPDAQIRENLQKGGWSKEEIDEGLGIPLENNDLVVPVKHAQVVAHGMWDAFEHILLFISLYILSSAIALILHTFVDHWLPGLLKTESVNYYEYYSFGVINDEWQRLLLRVNLASLIVSLPLFLIFFLDVTRRTIKDPSMRNIRARKILIYITLIITFLIMIGHIIYILYSFLDGDVTTNLFLHFFVTLIVNGMIFAYYLIQVKHDRRIHA